jgi:hypothetical protein
MDSGSLRFVGLPAWTWILILVRGFDKGLICVTQGSKKFF